MIKVLVIGDKGGQLGTMLQQAGFRIGIKVDHLDYLPTDILTYDVITAEKEHIQSDILPYLCSGYAIGILGNRLKQKELLDSLHIPNATWQVGAYKDSIIKSIKGGYDGRGQWKDPTQVPDNIDVISERIVQYSHELSLIGARTFNGECVFYPLVENIHDNGILKRTIYQRNLFNQYQHRAESKLTKIMNELNYVGVMAVEFFVEHETLLVNEIAPRVHNSGHWTMSGCDIDQFELHLRAIAKLPMRTPCVFVESTTMLNIIDDTDINKYLSIPNSRLYWYNKMHDANKSRRKLGHLNIVK